MKGGSALIYIPLIIMAFLSIFAVICGASLSGINIDDIVSVEQGLNGSYSTVDMGGSGATFSIDPIAGAVTWIAILVGLGCVIGIKIFGSGLSSTSVHLAFMGIFYTVAWSFLSSLALPFLNAIPIFGYTMYLLFTIAYAVGCIFKEGSR